MLCATDSPADHGSHGIQLAAEPRLFLVGYQRRALMDAGVPNAWQESRWRPVATNADKRVCAGQPHDANDDHRQLLSVPRFPWYY